MVSSFVFKQAEPTEHSLHVLEILAMPFWCMSYIAFTFDAQSAYSCRLAISEPVSYRLDDLAAFICRYLLIEISRHSQGT